MCNGPGTSMAMGLVLSRAHCCVLSWGGFQAERRVPRLPKSSPVLLGLSHEPAPLNKGAGAQGQGCYSELFERLVLSKHRLLPCTDSFPV